MLSAIILNTIKQAGKNWHLFYPKTPRDIISFLDSLTSDNKSFLPVDQHPAENQTPILIDAEGLKRWKYLKSRELGR